MLVKASPEYNTRHIILTLVFLGKLFILSRLSAYFNLICLFFLHFSFYNFLLAIFYCNTFIFGDVICLLMLTTVYFRVAMILKQKGEIYCSHQAILLPGMYVLIFKCFCPKTDLAAFNQKYKRTCLDWTNISKSNII